MRFQATHNLLTPLWNRGVIVELLLREVHRSCRERNCTAVMMCDICHFKSFNDSLRSRRQRQFPTGCALPSAPTTWLAATAVRNSWCAE